VRAALGATPGNIVGSCFARVMLTALGVVIGVSGAVAASQATITLLFGVSRLDPVTYLGMIGNAASDLGAWIVASSPVASLDVTSARGTTKP